MLSDEDINNIDIRYVALLDSDEAGDLYMEKLFPLWTDVIVVTLDGKYPENPALRERILRELQTNNELFCFTFGANAVTQLNVVSPKVLHLVDFFFADLINFPWQKPRLELNEDRIIVIMQAFSNKIANSTGRLNNYNAVISYFENATEPCQIESRKWYHMLVKS